MGTRSKGGYCNARNRKSAGDLRRESDKPRAALLLEVKRDRVKRRKYRRVR